MSEERDETIGIYWLSRHHPLPAQRAELRRVFGRILITEDNRPFGTTEELIARFQRSGCNEIVLVVPESMLRKLVDTGLQPLRAKMREVRELTDPARQSVAKHAVWEFVEFERVVRYEFICEPLF